MGLLGFQQNSIGTANALSLTHNFGATAKVGNLLLAVFSKDGANVDPSTPPSGYTLLAARADSNNNKHLFLYGKKSDGSETSVSATWAASGRITCDFMEITGAAVDGIIAGTVSIQAAANANTATGSTFQVSSVDPTSTGEVMMLASIVLGGTPGSQPTWDSSYTLVSDPNAVAGSRGFSGYLIGRDLGALAPTASWTTAQQRLAYHYVIPAARSLLVPPLRPRPALMRNS